MSATLIAIGVFVLVVSVMVHAGCSLMERDGEGDNKTRETKRAAAMTACLAFASTLALLVWRYLP